MSEYKKTDVGDFFVSKTENFEKSPPDSMWESIENQIPKYPVTNPLLKYFISGISLSVIVFSIFFIFYTPGPTSLNKTNQLISDKTDIIPTNSNQNSNINSNSDLNSNIANSVSANNTTEEKSQKPIINNNVHNKANTVIPNTEKTVVSIPEKSMKYSINAIGLKDISEITFENEKKENIIVVEKPIPNTFGFYEIDISKLPSGVYNIFITINGNKKLHKTETF